MADPSPRTSVRGPHRGFRFVALWTLTVLLGTWAGFDNFDRGDEDTGPASNSAAAGNPADATTRFRITGVSDAEVSPGSAIVVFVEGDDPDLPLTATLSKSDAEVLSRVAGRVVVRIPRGIEPGKASVRLEQPEIAPNGLPVDPPRRTKPHDLKVKVVRRGKLLRNLVGGLALLLFGLRTLSRGLRSWAGPRIRATLERLTQGTPAAVGFGVVVGGVTQLTSSAAGLVVGLVDARLLAFGSAAAVLLGAQFGAAATGALFPLAATREALPVIALGMVWISLGADRRSEAIGKILLGAGLLFYGLHLLNVGAVPLASDPEVLPLVGYLHAETFAGKLSCVTIGVALTFLLQGPGPVFALVLGILQTSGVLTLADGLMILAGCGLGSSLGTMAVAWAFGRECWRTAAANLICGTFSTLLTVAAVPVAVELAGLLVPGAAREIDYSHRLLLPNIALHLSVGFVASQLVATILIALALPWILRRVPDAMPSIGAPAHAPGAAEPDSESARRSLAGVVREDRAALANILALCRTGEREKGSEAEHALAEARGAIEALFPTLDVSRYASGNRFVEGVEALPRVTLALLQLQRTLEDLERVVERRTERNLRLSPRDAEMLAAHEELLAAGFDALLLAIESRQAPDLEKARAREIRLNGREARARSDVLERTGITLLATEVFDACENVGNHIYRVFEAFGTDADDAA